MEEDEIPEYIEFETYYYRSDLFQKPRYPEMLPIFPKGEKIWTFTLLSAFLNQLPDFFPSDHGFDKSTFTSKFRFRKVNSDKDYFLSIILLGDCITVKASTNYIIEEWNSTEKRFSSFLGAQNTIMTKLKLQDHLIFSKKFTDLSNSSISFLCKRSLLFNSKFDFTKIFHYFAKRLQTNIIPLNKDTEILFEYIKNFCNNKKSNINSFSDLEKNGVTCYMKFQIQPKITDKKLQSYVYQEKEFYIISGVVILPEAKSLLHNEKYVIDGYMLDTTWRIMPYYVTSILTACLFNTSVPIAYAFGHGETKDLYSFLLQTVESKMDVTFQGKVFASDQGTSLRALFREWGIIHLACIRHFYHNLKKFDYFYELRNIIKSATEFEYNNSINEFITEIKRILTENSGELSNINRSLKKIGFKYQNNNLDIINDEQWNMITMKNRVKYHMPTTTNSLESTHGHMNQRTPRRNNFFAALFRIHNELQSKYENLQSRIIHNYNYLKNLTIKKMNMHKPEEIRSMCVHYQTSIDSCLCSENKIESSNYKLDLPCFHRMFLGSNFDILPELSFEFSKEFNSLYIDQPILLPEETANENEDSGFSYAVRSIKLFSKHKKDNDIIKLVQEHKTQDRNCF